MSVYWPVGIRVTSGSILSGVVPPKGLLKTCKWPHNIRMHWNYYFLAHLFSQVCRVVLISFHYLTKKAILGHLIDSRGVNCLKSCAIFLFMYFFLSVANTCAPSSLLPPPTTCTHTHRQDTMRKPPCGGGGKSQQKNKAAKANMFLMSQPITLVIW